MTYQSPTQDIVFALQTLADLDRLGDLPGLEDTSSDLVGQLIEEGGKFFSFFELFHDIRYLGRSILVELQTEHCPLVACNGLISIRTFMGKPNQLKENKQQKPN